MRASDGPIGGDYVDMPARRRSPGSLVAVPLIAFLLGLLIMAWVLARWERGAELLGIRPAPAPPQIVYRTVAPAMTAPGQPSGISSDQVTERLARLEQRIGQIDNQTREAVGNADRAEGLLVAFAARRALDRGVGLGYLEGLLRQRFGAGQQAAVATVISMSRQPVTLEQLKQGLIEAAPLLSGPGPDQGWWQALRAELGGLVTVRQNGTPSTVPAERLERAAERLDAGQVDVALAEVLRLPGRTAAAEWIAQARRYVAARRALDRIETAALLDPYAAPPPAVSANR